MMSQNYKQKPINMSKSSNELTYNNIQMNSYASSMQRKYSSMFPGPAPQVPLPMHALSTQMPSPAMQPSVFKIMNIEENDVYLPNKQV